MSENGTDKQESAAEVDASEVDVLVMPEPPCEHDDVKKAFDTIKAAMVADCPSEPGSYAHSWHCNIAMMCHDAILDFDDQVDFAHEVGNDAATRFMKLCFGVDTKA